MNDTNDANRPKTQPLNVLVSSGQVEQLKREIMQDRELQEQQQQPAAPSTSDAPPASPPAPADAPSPTETIRRKLVEGKVIEALRKVYDPEIPVDIYELGLIYDIQVDANNAVKIKMTLTAPACPVAGTLPGEVETKVQSIPEVTSADVELVWDPPWDRSRMSEAAQLQLGIF